MNTYVREISVSYKGKARKALPAITDPKDAADFIRKVLPNNSKEHLAALYLDGRNHPIAYQIVSTGTANSAFVHPREVFQAAVLCGAVSLILAHNHPSDDLTPSREDIEVTHKIKDGGKLLGINVLDHVIITNTRYRSILN